MSAFYDVADKLADAFKANTVIAGAGLGIIIERQQDLEKEIVGTLARLKGCIAIQWNGFSPNEENNADDPVLRSRYTLSVWGHDILRKGHTKNADVIQAVCKVVNSFNSQAAGGHCQFDAVLGSAGPWIDGKSISRSDGSMPFAGFVVMPIEITIPIVLL